MLFKNTDRTIIELQNLKNCQFKNDFIEEKDELELCSTESLIIDFYVILFSKGVKVRLYKDELELCSTESLIIDFYVILLFRQWADFKGSQGSAIQRVQQWRKNNSNLNQQTNK